MWFCLFQRDVQLFRATENEHKPHQWFSVGGQKWGKVEQGKAKGQQATESETYMRTQANMQKRNSC